MLRVSIWMIVVCAVDLVLCTPVAVLIFQKGIAIAMADRWMQLGCVMVRV